MNQGDALASGAKSASFTANDKKEMTKEQWDAMFASVPESFTEKAERLNPLELSRAEYPGPLNEEKVEAT